MSTRRDGFNERPSRSRLAKGKRAVGSCGAAKIPVKIPEIGRRTAARARGVITSRRTRRWSLGILIALVIYTGVGFFAVPAILRHVLIGSVAKSLNRPVSVGEIAFNPFRLRLEIDQLRVAGHKGSSPFVKVGRFEVEASWHSLWHLAPIIEEVTIERPTINIVRTAPNTFNFSDLVPPPKPAPAQPVKPFLFSVSNIRISGGKISFDDRVLAQRHAIDDLVLDVPFVADLPADVKVYVKPQVRMVIDGSPLHIAGTARPFNTEPESELVLKLQSLEISRYLGYLPRKLPITIPRGALSSYLLIHFVQAPQGAQIRIGGSVRLDQLEVRDANGAPLVGLKRLALALDNVEPLHSYIHLGAVKVDGLDTYLTLNHDGTTNLTPLMASGARSGPSVQPSSSAPSAAAPKMASGAPQPPAGATSGPPPTPLAAATPSPVPGATASAAPISPLLTQAAPAPVAGASPAPAAKPAPNPAGQPALDLKIVSLDLTNSAVHLQDNQLQAPMAMALQAIVARVGNFHLGAGPPIPFNFNAALSGGGTIAAQGALDLAGSAATTSVTLAQIDVPALQGLAQSLLAAKIAAGKLNASANVRAAFAPGQFNLHLEPAAATLDGFEILMPGRGAQPIKWNSVGARIAMADLASRQATIDSLSTDGVSVEVIRERHGKLNLESLLKPPPGARRASARHRSARRAHPAARRRKRGGRNATAMAAGGAPPWRYQIGAIALEKTAITLLDESPRHPLRATIAPLDVNLKNVTNDFAKPFGVAIDATVNRGGTLKVTGETALQPLKAKLRVVTRRIDLTPANDFIADRMNATITRATLTSDGEVSVIAAPRRALRLGYRGNATLGDVRMLDKLTRDLFTRWRTLSFSRIDFTMGQGKPRVDVGAIALSNFYARVILNRDARLNLSEIMANPRQAPTSLTRANPTGPAPVPTPAAGGAPAAPKPLPADIRVGRILLRHGEINYTDDFIRPNYSADLTAIAGKIGAFGTSLATPADVLLTGLVNGNAPIDINGSINPLTPMAYINIKAHADQIDLPALSAYSTKYTGYPITSGMLTVDVHYLLDQQKLTAQNHIRIDQLTFGAKVSQPSVYNLPLRLAVAILKDPQGRINLDIPVSGSLNDPQFSLGGVIWRVFSNLIMNAVTAPFQLLAAALPGSGGGAQLSYVGFKPGFARLSADDRSKLDKVAAALKQRAALKLKITGRVDPALDTPGLRAAMLDELIRRQKAKDSGVPPAGLESMVFSDGDYDKYLTIVYKDAAIPKPRDFVGLAKSLPPAEMKKLLIAHMKVTPADLPKLGQARAAAVRGYLAAQIAPARMEVAPAKIGAGKSASNKPPTRVDLSLE